MRDASYGVASATSQIDAPPERIYAILRDYREHHPRVLPPEFFLNLDVEEGGVGAGTRAFLVMRVLGVTRTMRFLVSEPAPGRELVEADTEGSVITKFTVDRAGGDARTMLTIRTEFRVRPGAAGAVEKMMTAFMLRRIYRKEMALIAAYAATHGSIVGTAR